MATFIVTSNADGEAGSELTLREAIAAANGTAGADLIEFDGGVFSGGDANTIRLSNELGSLLITDSVTIDASRVAGITVTGDASANDITDANGITDIKATGQGALLDNVRPIAVTGDNEETTLRGLTLTGGYIRGPSSGVDVSLFSAPVPGAGSSNGYSGGGLFVDEGSVNFLDGAVSGNGIIGRGVGGGIFFNETINPFNPAPTFDILRVVNSSVEGNHLVGDASGTDGGINARFLQLENSTVAFNSTSSEYGSGGGIEVTGDGSLRNATIFGNYTTGRAADGGGVHAQNNLEILNSTITANRVEGERATGGGFQAYGGSAGTESIIGGDEKRIANSIIIGNVSNFRPATNDVALSIYSPTAEGRDQNTFDGVNIIGDLNNPRPELTAYNGSIIDRPASSIFVSGGELADNGGDVKTVKLLDATSNPAIDGSGEGALEADAIGRPAQDFPGRGGDDGLPGVRDIGAFELPLLTGGLPEEPIDPEEPVDPEEPIDPPAPTGPTNGDDTLLGTALNNTINALAGDDNVNGLAGDDLLIGGGGNDSIKGAAGDDRLRGNGGEDTLKGGGGDDNIKGGGGGDVIRGNGGADVVRAGGGEDNVKGGGGDDLILGGGGADRLNGGGGADTLKGNGGDDTLKGNGGADVFQFRASDRNDTISDFRQGQDRIEIQSGARNFEALAIEQDGRDVLIGFGAGQVRVVTDSVAAFDESDFIF